jgi:hypothetical protein
MAEAEGVSEKTVIVMGAGCSFAYGFPLAHQTLDHLQRFARELEGSTQHTQVRTCVLETIDLFQRYREKNRAIKTLDQLVDAIHGASRATERDQTADERADRCVNRAKIAEAALFIWCEKAAIQRGLDGYRKLLNWIFGKGSGRDYHPGEMGADYAVFSFNYDRLFELAFQRRFRLPNLAFYGPDIMNSGLYVLGNRLQPIPLDRFALLKLHGSVSFRTDEFMDLRHEGHPPQIDGEDNYGDSRFFAESDSRGHSRMHPPLIVFPHEQPFLKDYPNGRFAHREYTPHVAAAARKFAARATELWIVGYSCPSEDCDEIRDMLDAATGCKRILVRDPNPDSVCQKLLTHLRTNSTQIVPIRSDFENAF